MQITFDKVETQNEKFKRPQICGQEWRKSADYY